MRTRGLLGASVALVVVGLWALAGVGSAWGAEGEGCPNEAIRLEQGSTYLPQCRAYEMVTPPYKEGYPLFVASYAADGEQAILSTLGNLNARAEGEAGDADGLYLGTRGPGGWQLSSMNPSLTEYVGQIPLAFEASNGYTLWEQHTPQQSATTRGFYVQSAVGAFSYIGSASPYGAGEEQANNFIEGGSHDYDKPVGATDNFQHVVLEARNKDDYWSFDRTEGEGGSIYEYGGLANSYPGPTPELIGVNGPKASTELIGLCGTRFGSGSQASEDNAISTNGETIFFTVLPVGTYQCRASAPATAELYARLHGSRSTKTEAETVELSKNQCTEMCGPESGKNFEGASEDGEVVFFTSTQKLTNNAINGTGSGNAFHENGCAETILNKGGCNLYEYNFSEPTNQRLTAIASGEVLGVAGIAENGERVYFVSRNALPVEPNLYGATPQAAQPNFYVYDTQSKTLGFIATLSESRDWEDWRRYYSRPVEVTGPSGEYVLFASSSPKVTPDDHTTTNQLFEYDAQTKELVRVTQGEDDYDDNGLAVEINSESISYRAQWAGAGQDFHALTNPLNVSANGQTVVFETGGQLSPLATSAKAGCLSVYEFHSDGPIVKGQVHLLSDGRDEQLNKGTQCGAEFVGMDEFGDNVLISTADSLLPTDTDGFQRDIYDARVDGGIAPVGSSVSCEGAGCAGGSSAPSVFGAPSSATLTGGGNLVAPAGTVVKPVTKRTLGCPRGKRRSRGRCVKRRARKRAGKRTEKAGGNRRAGR